LSTIRPRISRNVKALGAVSFLTDAHSETILPLLPLFLANVLRVDMKFIGLIEGVSGAVTSILQGLSGRVSDIVGKRKALVTAGYTLSSVSKLVLSFAQSGGQVFGARFADRCGKGVRTSPRDALIAESTVEKARGGAFGFHRMMDTAGAFVGAAAAIFLMRLFQGNMRTVFLWAAIPGFLAVLTCVVFVRETPPPISDRELPTVDRAPMSAALKRFLVVNGVFCLGNFSYQFFMLRSQSLGVATTAILVQYLVYNGVYSATAVPIGNLSDRIGRKWFLAGAYLSYAIVTLLFAAAVRPWHAWVLFLLYGIHCGIFNPVSRAYVSDFATRNRMGTAMGFYHMSVGFATLVASSVAGLLWDRFGPQAAFAYGATLAGVAFIMLILLCPEAHFER